MPRIIHFEFCVQEPERAVEFYEKLFAWKVQK
jgi:predicted enzyme related to lactoylglutathione lyase